MTELIGEEIYDEFDPQGHPDLTSYGPSESKVPSILKRKGSAPEFGVSVSSPNTPRLTESTLAPSMVAPSAHKPIALPALKSLNFKLW